MSTSTLTKPTRRGYEVRNPSDTDISNSLYGSESIYRVEGKDKVYALIYDIPADELATFKPPTGNEGPLDSPLSESEYKQDKKHKRVQLWIEDSLRKASNQIRDAYSDGLHLNGLRFDARYLIHKEMEVVYKLLDDHSDLPAVHWAIYRIHYRDGGDRNHTKTFYDYVDGICKKVYNDYPWLDITVPGSTD